MKVLWVHKQGEDHSDQDLIYPGRDEDVPEHNKIVDLFQDQHC